MARRRIAAKRKIIPDSIYHSEIVASFVNCIMTNGKKSIAEKIVYGAFDEISKRSKHTKTTVIANKEKDKSKDKKEKDSTTALEIFLKALENVSPIVEVRAKRVGGSTYQIPVEVNPKRRQALGMRWLKNAAKERSGRSMTDKLAAELLDAVEERGGAFKKKEEAHRMAKSNQAFAHIRTAG